MPPRQVLTAQQLRALEQERLAKQAAAAQVELESSPLLDALRRYLDGLH